MIIRRGLAAFAIVSVALAACGQSMAEADKEAFCDYLEATRQEILFDIEMAPAEILATTQRAQEVYTEAATLAPASVRPHVETGIESWSNLETRFGEAFEAGLNSEEAFNAILVEWEELVDVPANDAVVAYYQVDCGRGAGG